MCEPKHLYLDADLRFKVIPLSTGLPLLCASLRLSPAEEHCGDAAQQRPAAAGESHTETTAPSEGETRNMT